MQNNRDCYALRCSRLHVTLALAQDKGKGGPKGPPDSGFDADHPDFEDGGIIPDKFTQAIPDAVSPKLEWDQRARRHAELCSDACTIRITRSAKKLDDVTALDGVQHSRDRTGPA